ncbi:MAG TPA: hypothetical protein VFH87_01640 [Candidatus Udaeobacter sp.]|nr:hypothetical protein [Candidatus Udaeobacter sp.]
MSKPKKDPTEEWIKRLDEGPENEEDEGEDYPISLATVLLLIFGLIAVLGLLSWFVLSLLGEGIPIPQIPEIG